LRFSNALAVLGLQATLVATPATLAVAQQPSLVVQNAWVRAAPGADVAAAYVTLRNVSNSDVTVTGVESPVAGHAMIHETRVQSGQSRMRPRESLTLHPQSTLKFEPGGLHIMLHDLKQPLTVGQSVPLVFDLAGGSSIKVTAVVRPLTAE
jgi:copper(I)-binding protein